MLQSDLFQTPSVAGAARAGEGIGFRPSLNRKPCLVCLKAEEL